MRSKFFALVSATLLLLTTLPTTTCAEGVLQASSEYWSTLQLYEKYAFVEGYIGGLYCMSFLMKTGGAYGEREERALMPDDGLVIREVVKKIDEWYESTDAKKRSVPVYALAYELMKRRYPTYK